VDLTLSKRGDYVVRSAITLARAYDAEGWRKIREVVEETDVPQTFASQILADLVRAGLATSRAGRSGGYRLSRAPTAVSVLEVIEAGEGPLRSERCALGEGPCRWENVCPLHETWTAATAALRELLSRTTLAELAARDAALEAGTYPVPVDSHRAELGSFLLADQIQVECAAETASAALGLGRPPIAPLLAEALTPSLRGAWRPATDPAEKTSQDGGRAAGSSVDGGRAAGSSVDGGRAADSGFVGVLDASVVPIPPGAPDHAVPDGAAVQGSTARRSAGAKRGAAGEAAPGAAPERARFLLGWRLGVPGQGSRLEGGLTVHELDGERSAPRLAAEWHQRVGLPPSTPLETVEAEARRVVRRFLRQVAAALESATGEDGGTGRT